MMRKKGKSTVYRIGVRSELSNRYASDFEGMEMETKKGQTIPNLAIKCATYRRSNDGRKSCLLEPPIARKPRRYQADVDQVARFICHANSTHVLQSLWRGLYDPDRRGQRPAAPIRHPQPPEQLGVRAPTRAGLVRRRSPKRRGDRELKPLTGTLTTSPAKLIHPSAWKGNSANFALTEF